jgi:hypothetical protein
MRAKPNWVVSGWTHHDHTDTTATRISARSKVLRHQNRDRLLIESGKLTASWQGASIGTLDIGDAHYVIARR